MLEVVLSGREALGTEVGLCGAVGLSDLRGATQGGGEGGLKNENTRLNDRCPPNSQINGEGRRAAPANSQRAV